MKKILLTALLLTGLYSQAQQISVTTRNSQAVEDGSVFTFTSLDHYAEMPLLVTNISEDELNIKILVEGVINSDGEDVQLCFGGICLYNVSEGTLYPPNFPVNLAPGESNLVGDHMWNFNTGIDPTEIVSYQLGFVIVDENNNILESLLSFEYQYAPELSTGDFNQLGVTQINTLVEDYLQLSSTAPAALKVYGLNGNLVQQSNVEAGENAIFLGGISKGIYVVQLENHLGKAQVKVLKK